MALQHSNKDNYAPLLTDLQGHIEAIIFSAEQAVGINEIVRTLEKIMDNPPDVKEVYAALEALLAKYRDESYAFEIRKISEGYQFLTKPPYHPTIAHFLNIRSRRRLSTAAMETLSIIAYKQPVPKSEIENIRGVNCDYTIQKLLEKELIEIGGRAESPGKPLLYVTSKAFMDYFGIQSLEELPKLKEIEPGDNQIGIIPLEEPSENPDSRAGEAES